MTPAEARAVEFIREHIRQFGRAPYQKQISGHLNISRGYVSRLLDNMERKGLINRVAGVPGGISVPDAAPGPAGAMLRIELRQEIRTAVGMIAEAEGASVTAMVADWIAERVAHELRSRVGRAA